MQGVGGRLISGSLTLKFATTKLLNKKTMLLLGAGLVIGTGAYLNYRMAQQAQREPISDLTLANIEAMANPEFGPIFKWKCVGTGSVPCPDGRTARKVVIKEL